MHKTSHRYANNSVSHLIGWLSLCVLAAGWGSALDPSWRPIWREMGVFGLASALGLSTAARLRAARKRIADQRAAERRLDRRIATLIDEATPCQDVYVPQDRVQHDMSREDGNLAEIEQRLRVATKRRWAAVVTPLGANGDAAPSREALIQNASKTGIGLTLEEPLPLGPARLTFRQSGGTLVSMLMEVCWSQRMEPGRSACGLAFKAMAPAGWGELDRPILERAASACCFDERR